MVNRILKLVALAVLSIGPATGVTLAGTADSLDWALVWNDEFSGPAGQSPNSGNWGYDIGTDWGNAQLEYDTDRPFNVSLDGSGNLAIIAREESYMGQPYTSARIVTRDLYQPTYGRIEARIQMPTGQGLWPAFWLLGSDITTVGWPQCGEIDIMEFLGQETDVIYGTLHGPGYFGGSGISQSYVLPSGQFDTEFHEFAIEWEEDEIRWYMDNILFHSVQPADVAPNEWVFNHPFYIILNVAVGGNWVGPPDGTTVFPQTMLVDYVRVYQRGAGVTCCRGERGNVNADISDGVDISDLTTLVNHLFVTFQELPCPEEANTNGDEGGSIDISDLTKLVNHLFITFEPLPECPLSASFVFSDQFDAGVTYQAIAGSKLDAVRIDESIAYQGTRSLEITVPDAGDPLGSYAGGAFTTTIARDLVPFNALSFWARASANATLDVAGIGNDNTGTSLYTAEVSNLALTTTWQKYVIPFPLSEKLVNEDGLFYFAEGPEDGLGYQIWFDEIMFENLPTITNPRPAITTQTIDAEVAEEIVVENGRVTFDVNGSDVVVSALPGYFTYMSSNEAVVSVDVDGIMWAVGAGTATLTAQLGTLAAAGTVTVLVTAAPDAPATPATPPTADPADVIALFSDAYTDVPIDTWSAVWDQADVEDFSIGADNIKKYTNLVFAGIEFTSATIDASTMTRIHMDVWTPDPTDAPAEFKVKLVDFGADGTFGGGDDVEYEMSFDESTMNTGEWVSIDVALNDFTNLTTREHLAQLLISGDAGTVFVDNLYLYTADVSVPVVPAPPPTTDPADVISLFSDAYTDVPVDTWSAVWDQAEVEDFLIGANNIKKYTNLVFAGIEFTSATIDASTMTRIHMDVWTPDPTSAPSVFKIKLVDFGPNGVFDGGDDVEHEVTLDESTMTTAGWVSLEIPLTDFVNLTTREHLAQLIISGDPSTVYVDNVYFRQ